MSGRACVCLSLPSLTQCVSLSPWSVSISPVSPSRVPRWSTSCQAMSYDRDQASLCALRQVEMQASWWSIHKSMSSAVARLDMGPENGPACILVGGWKKSRMTCGLPCVPGNHIALVWDTSLTPAVPVSKCWVPGTSWAADIIEQLAQSNGWVPQAVP